MLSISQVAARSGLRASAIRYYETRGLVQSVGRSSGKRCFDDSVIARLAAIELAKAAGFTLNEIGSVFSSSDAGDRPPWKHMAGKKSREIENEIQRLQRTRALLGHLATCTCESVDGCGHAFIGSNGAERTRALRRRSPVPSVP